MKQLTISNAAPAVPASEPRETFVNLYLESGICGLGYGSVEDARLWRGSKGGITVRIARDEHGDFIIEKVEEF